MPSPCILIECITGVLNPHINAYCIHSPTEDSIHTVCYAIENNNFIYLIEKNPSSVYKT